MQLLYTLAKTSHSVLPPGGYHQLASGKSMPMALTSRSNHPSKPLCAPAEHYKQLATDKGMAADVVAFIREWRKLFFPRLAAAPFWLAGESYAGWRAVWLGCMFQLVLASGAFCVMESCMQVGVARQGGSQVLTSMRIAGGWAGKWAAYKTSTICCFSLDSLKCTARLIATRSVRCRAIRAGHYVPHITLQLLEHNAQASGSSDDKIDFHGFLLGGRCALHAVRCALAELERGTGCDQKSPCWCRAMSLSSLLHRRQPLHR